MTEVLSAWRSELRFSLRDYLSNPRVTIVPPPPPQLPFNLNFDDGHFNSPLHMDEIMVDSPKTSLEVTQPRLRVVLIPSPPPLPTHQMLVDAALHLHPHPLPRRYHTAVNSIQTQPTSLDPISDESVSPAVAEGLIPCCVCMENREPEHYPTDNITENCWHPNLTCLRCLEYSIASDHSSKMWDNIQCPQCSVQLSYENVKRFADKNTFAHYDMLVTRQALSKLENFVWCTSCTSGQFHLAASDCPEVVCKECSAVTCFTHRVPWHKGLTCHQYDRVLRHSTFSILKSTISSFAPQSSRLSASPTSKKPDDGKAMIAKILNHKREAKASARGIRRECKKCPGIGCGAMIYKIDGCKHMTCFKCTHEFCWRCKTDWFYGHKCWKVWRKA